MSSARDYAGRSRVVAIAGASGGAGQHIAEGLLQGGFQLVLLVRKANPDLVEALKSFAPSSASVGNALVAETVDFSSRAQLAEIFRQRHVDTVISALALFGDEWHIEENMMHAAIDAGVRRFAPSSLAGPVELSEQVRAYEFKRKMLAVVKNAPISWTHFNNGIFMNYFGSAAPTKASGPPQGHLNPLKFVVDVEAGTATIPGTGNEPQVFTEITDVGRGVALACALEGVWTPTTGWMVGDRATYNDVVRIAEKVTGRKFDVKYVSFAELDEKCAVPVEEQSATDRATMMKTFYWEAMRMCAMAGATHDDGLGPALRKEGKEQMWKPVGVQAFLELWWKSPSPTSAA